MKMCVKPQILWGYDSTSHVIWSFILKSSKDAGHWVTCWS